MQLDWFFGVVKRGYDAAVFPWARQSEVAGGLEGRLTDAVKQWIA